MESKLQIVEQVESIADLPIEEICECLDYEYTLNSIREVTKVNLTLTIGGPTIEAIVHYDEIIRGKWGNLSHQKCVKSENALETVCELLGIR